LAMCLGGKFTLSQSIILYRKLKADLLFTGHEMLGPDSVLVTDQKGTVVEIIDSGDTDAEYLPGILCPGLINAHCHAELSHLKGRIPKHTGLVDFVQRVLKLRGGEEEEKLASIVSAEEEMILGGIVAVGDICNTADTINKKRESVLHWRNFVEVSGFVDATSRKRLDEAIAVKEKFKEAFIVPHASYSVSETLFELIAARREKFVSIHNQESIQEDVFYQKASGDFLQLYANLGIDISSFQARGKSSFQYWSGYFSPQQNIISVHNTFTGPKDIRIAIERKLKIWFCICPGANLYIENTLPPVEMLRENSCRIILGTDSYASNESLSIAGEMKLIQENFPGIPLGEILKWATLNGAQALDFEGLGSFDVGKKPGIVQLGMDRSGKLTGSATRIL
ncbi:MAG: amidohydrolase, partial [Chitinophagaceae bacterium]